MDLKKREVDKEVLTDGERRFIFCMHNSRSCPYADQCFAVCFCLDEAREFYKPMFRSMRVRSDGSA